MSADASRSSSCPTLVLPPRYTEDSYAMWRAAVGAGWNVERLAGWRPPEWLAGREIVLYGEPLFAAVVADALGLALIEPHFGWLADLPGEHRRRDVRLTTLREARALRARAFIKPADDKCFEARVYASGEELAAPDVLSEETPVLVAEPVAWEVEYRCFVLEQRVVTMSPYLRDGALARAADGIWPAPDRERAEALACAEEVLRDSSVRLPPAVTLDVGRIAGRGWAVVEANAAWGSGIYGCDPAEVLHVCRRACLARAAAGDADRAWIIQRGG